MDKLPSPPTDLPDVMLAAEIRAHVAQRRTIDVGALGRFVTTTWRIESRDYLIKSDLTQLCIHKSSR